MTDKELLELAARAAAVKGHFGLRGESSNFWLEDANGQSIGVQWSPLTDDGDALRLAVKLTLQVMPQKKCCYVQSNPETLLGMAEISEFEMNGNDPYAATRRAIVRAAAEIGK